MVLISLQDKMHYRFDTQLTIGRNPDNTVQINDSKVSRYHAVIEWARSKPVIRDLNSKNGTYVGQQKISKKSLKPGDLIRIGTKKFRLEIQKEQAFDTVVGHQHVSFQDEAEGLRIETSLAKSVYRSFFASPGKTATKDQLRAAQGRLAAVSEANQIISSERDLNKLFETIIDQIFSLTPAHNGVILLNNDATGKLQTEYAKCGSSTNQLIVSTTIINRVFDRGEAVLTYDAADDTRFKDGFSIISQNISSAMCVPLRYQKETLGVIYVDTHGTTNAFEQGDLELLVALSGSASIAVKNAQYVNDLQQAYHDTLVVTANAIEMRDHYTVGHTWRVTNYAVEIAKEMGWNKERLALCEKGGVLHDVGKIAVHDAILGKVSHLTDEEFSIMKIHPERGAGMMRDVSFLKSLIPYCLYHHERWDGKGYPHGLKGRKIPIEGRIIAVADTFDAMTSSRPYRKVMDRNIAIEEIKKCAGTQFDPSCVDAFLKCYRDGRIDRILQDYYANDSTSLSCPFCSTYVKPPQDAVVGSIIKCDVCRRHLQLQKKNESYFGKLVPESEAATRKKTVKKSVES